MAPRTKLHLHIENARRKAGVFHLTAEDYAAAARRHRALARQLRVTIGWGSDILDGALQTADILIGMPTDRTRLKERAPRLRWIHTPSSGIDPLLPLDWLPAGAAFTNNVGAHGAKAEEYMRMAFTMLHARMPEIIANQRARHWQQLLTPPLKGKTALIVGLGDLGSAAARAARQLGLKVLAVRRSGEQSPLADRVYRLSQLDRLLPRADFVVLAVPLTPETRNLLDRRRLDLLRPAAGVINIARAPLADYAALREKLANGTLASAMLDVVAPEPLPADSALWNTPNLIITPHVSCDDGDDYAALTLDLFFENLARFVARRPLKNRVDPRLGY